MAPSMAAAMPMVAMQESVNIELAHNLSGSTGSAARSSITTKSAEATAATA